ncbi:MAG: hypothetical protein RLZZ419_1839, partial [Pseudomonadota bacterium]
MPEVRVQYCYLKNIYHHNQCIGL